MTRWTISGTDEGGLLGLSPTARRVTFGGIFVDRVADGRIIEHWGQSDMVGLLTQLGLMPPGRAESLMGSYGGWSGGGPRLWSGLSPHGRKTHRAKGSFFATT